LIMRTTDLLFAIFIYLLCVFLVALFWRNSLVLTGSTLIISVIVLMKWHAKMDFAYYFMAFFLGPIAEVAAVYFGAWKYNAVEHLIPVWLPFLWGIAGLLLLKINETLNNR
jgi:hypothetical protein